MTRLKKELIKKSTTSERIRRIKDQKKVVNSKNVKISEFHAKKLLESVEQQNLAEEKLLETNNNHVTNDEDNKNGCDVDVGKKMADSEEKENLQVAEEKKSDMGVADIPNDKIENKEGTEKEEEMQDFELVGLSPESQKTKPATSDDEKTNNDDVKSSLKEELEAETKQDQEEEETDRAESDEEDSDDDRRRKSNEDDESEDERDGTQSDGESDYQSVSDNDDERESDDRSSGREDKEDNNEENEEEMKSPTFVPRRTGFWDHDDRFSDIKVQESREPPQGSKKLWDKSEVDRWQHDMYVESEQGPKEQWEVEQSQRDFEEGRGGRRGGRGGNRRRGDRNFGDFIQQDGGDNRGRRGPRGGGRGGRGGYRQNRYDDRNEDGERPSQDVRMTVRNQEQEWPSLNQKQYNNKRSPKKNDNRRNNKEESWGGPVEGAIEDWSKSDKGDQGYPYKRQQDTGSRDNSRDSYGSDRRDDRRDDRRGDHRDDRRDDRRSGSEEKQPRKDYGNKQDKRRSHETDTYQQERADEYPKRSENPNKMKGKGRGLGRGRGRDNDTGDSRPGDNEKTNREKRIDSLPPRLRDKARKKMVQDQNKGKQPVNEEQNENESGQFEDQSAYNYDDGQADGGASRDKPKRYSSQRQKTGASVMDIPSQMNDNDATRQYLEQLAFLQQQMSPDKNIRALEQQILQLQTQLQQQLNLRSMQQPIISQPNIGMQMPNMVSPLVTGMEQVYGGDSSMYNMSQGIIPNNTGGGEPMGMLNPQINPMVLNQILAAAQQQQQQQAATGLYLPPQNIQPQQPPVLPQQPPPPQQQPLGEGESRRSRPAAIPIKPPPGL